MTETRVLFRDVKPYEIVDSLDDLAGPAHGEITLPVRVFWSGTRRTFEVDNPSLRRQAYQAVLSNGLHEHLVRYLNRDRLLETWPDLHLDARVVALWSERFAKIAEIPRVQ